MLLYYLHRQEINGTANLTELKTKIKTQLSHFSLDNCIQRKGYTMTNKLKPVMGTITVSGIVGGNNWDNQTCTKSFTEDYSNAKKHSVWSKDWNGLRNAILSITNDEDFASCSIVQGFLSFTMFTRLKNGKLKEEKYTIELHAEMKQIKDCFVGEDEKYTFLDILYPCEL